jgi:imidazole glycerol-phosphate synthase subunit HisH
VTDSVGEPGPLVAVIDYGIGNLHSAQKAFVRVGANAHLTTDLGLIADAALVVLPGVGAFGACMDALEEAGMAEVALDVVTSGRPFMGICVGMQMLFDGSDELPGRRGLGVVPGMVRWLPDTVKRPQMQWNRLAVRRDDPALTGLTDDAWVYFVHSFHGVPTDPNDVVATVEYGTDVTAVIRRGNVVATQFHPEKSGRSGMALLANVVRSVSPGVHS